MAWIACPSCQKTISGNADVCPYCGVRITPSTPLTSGATFIRRTFLFLGLVALGMLVLAIGVMLTRTDASPTRAVDAPLPAPAVEPTREQITSATLAEMYEQNEIRADSFYKGATVDVTGPIVDIGTDILGSPYVVLGTNSSAVFGVQAVFARGDKARLASLSKGETATIRCTLAGKTLINIIGRDCSVR